MYQLDHEANKEIAPFLYHKSTDVCFCTGVLEVVIVYFCIELRHTHIFRSPQKNSGKLSVVSNEWETIDPTPDLHALFIEFNQTFFWGRLLRQIPTNFL